MQSLTGPDSWGKQGQGQWATPLRPAAPGPPRRKPETPPLAVGPRGGCAELGVAEAATVGRRLAAAGIPTLHGHTATLWQLVLQAPPSAVAWMLGYHTVHAEAIAAEADGTWKRYAPGDHTR